MWWSARPEEPRSSVVGVVLAMRSSRRFDQGVHLLRRQVVVVAVLVAHHGRELAGPQALDLLDAELAVAAHLTEVLHGRALLDVLADLRGAPQRAGQVGADREVVTADRRQVEERV